MMAAVNIVAASEVTARPDFRAKWEHLLNQFSGTTLFYQSPEYFDHLSKLHGDCAFLAIVEGDDGEPIAFVPMRRTSVFLKFEMREHRLAQASYSGIRLLGGTLLAPQ